MSSGTHVGAKYPIVGPGPEKLLSRIGMTLEDFTQLKLCAKNVITMSGSQIDKWSSAVGLIRKDDYSIPPDGKPRSLNISEAEIQTVIIEDTWDEFFKPPTNESLSLRRGRLRDLPTIYGNYKASEADPVATKDPADLMRKRLRYFGNYRDCIFVYNVMVAAWLFDDHGFDLINYLWERGGLDSRDDYLALCKKINLAKNIVVNGPTWLIIELDSLVGFRLLNPDDGIDLVEKTREISQGQGLSHESDDGMELYGWVDCIDILDTDPKGSYLTVDEFIEDFYLYATSGASSFGRLKFKIDHKEKSVKARKLMLQYCSNAKQLKTIMESAMSSVNVAVLKPELKKLRIAVSGDLGYYLVWAYLHQIYGDMYRQWPGVSLGEKPEETFKRTRGTLDSLRLCHGFAFDFERFDSQPTTPELVILGKSYIACALKICPYGLPDWLTLNAINGLKHSTLETPPQSKIRHVFPVSNYLPSGIYITSAIGNSYNAVACTSIIRLIVSWLGINSSVWLKDIAIRGDDTSFTVTNIYCGFLICVAAEIYNYKFAKGKLSIVFQSTEFLRIHYSVLYGARGYAGRVIPSLAQRKPWSNDPWDPEGKTRAWWSTCCTLERRGMSGISLWDRLVRVWSQSRSLDSAILGVPSGEGGLSLGRPVLSRLVRGKIGVVPDIKAEIVTPSSWAQELVDKRWLKAGLVSTYEQRLAAVKDSAKKTLTTADTPVGAKTAQRMYKESLSKTQVLHRNEFYLDDGVMRVIARYKDQLLALTRGNNYEDVALIPPPTSFGKYYYELQKITVYREAKQYGVYVPDIQYLTDDAIKLAKKWRTSVHIAEDWLCGVPPSACYSYVHPEITSQLVKLTAGLTQFCFEHHTGGVGALGLNRTFAYVAWELATSLTQSEFHNYYYSW